MTAKVIALMTALILSPMACFGAAGGSLAGARESDTATALPAQGWTTMPDLPGDEAPVVLLFRRTLDLAKRPSKFLVHVTADNRFILYVNGARVADGPSTADVAHWREEAVDLAPHLHTGRNIVAVVVWNAVKQPPLSLNATEAQRRTAAAALYVSNTAPKFQQSIATGFRLVGDGAAAEFSTGRPGWRVRRDSGHSFENGFTQVSRWFYVAGSPETVDAARSPAGWKGASETGLGWTDAVPAPAAIRPLLLDALPQQLHRSVSVGSVVRTDLPGGAAGFPSKPIVVPANTTATVLLQRNSMIAAYPEIDVSGGAGATITATWSEALYDEAFKKGDRDLVGNRQVYGVHDTFLPNGKRWTFAPLWWRAWRYAELKVKTKDSPLVIEGMRIFQTGYPFRQIGRFASEDDPTLQRIFDIGWRTAQLDAHETYMDTAYWEQLQYAGDTRLQMLISYAIAGDPRLAVQAIDAFAASDFDDGLTDGAYPERGSNVIAPFSLLWVGMLDDWRMHQPDPAPIVRNIPRMRRVLEWFDAWQGPSGLLRKNPQWNFIDWIGQPPTDRTRFPSYGKTDESCLTSISWLGALQQGVRIEQAFGDTAHAIAYRNRADRLIKALRTRCWVPARGLYADNPDGVLFSQQMNALAVLYDVATRQEAAKILDRIVVPGRGIDAPQGVATTSYYFAWYLAQAFAHAGRADAYLGLLNTWRDLLKFHYTTWPEERGDTRTDSHAWSAHPSADLLGLVAGIQPGAPGYAKVRIAPAPATLRSFDARAATPSGAVRVRYRKQGGVVTFTVDRPVALPGDLHWRGRSYPLTTAHTVIRAR